MPDQSYRDPSTKALQPGSADGEQTSERVDDALDQLDAGVRDAMGATVPFKKKPRGAASDGPASASSPDANAPPPQDEESEVSIDEYMAALLARCRGTSEPDPSVAGPAAAAESAFRATQRMAIGGQRKPDAAAQEDAAGEAAPERRLRQPPPERRETLTSMRDVANVNTRTSLSTHNGRELIVEMHGRLLMTMIFLVTSFALIGFTSTVHSLTYYGAFAALIVAAAWTVRCLKLSSRVNRIAAEVQLTIDEDEPAAESAG